MNDDPRAPWNDPDQRDALWAPWNDPQWEDSPRAPWNDPLAEKPDYLRWCEVHKVRPIDRGVWLP